MNMKYARIDEEKKVQEVIVAPEGMTIADCVHESLVSQYTLVAEDVVVGSTQNGDGTFNAPAVVNTRPPANLITTTAFAKRFTVEERAAREAALTDTSNAEAAKLRVYHQDLMADFFVDMNAPLTATYVQQHETMNLVTADRAAAILTDEVQLEEQTN
jgi:hypothetical protein